MRFLRDSPPSPSSIRWFLPRRNEQGLHLMKTQYYYSPLGDPRKYACVCGGDWFLISEHSRECGREGRHEDDKILTSPLERWATSPHLLDSWKHFICVPSYPSKAKIYIGCVFIFSSLDCCDRREKEDKREQMREKLVRGGKNTKQTSDMVFRFFERNVLIAIF